MADGVDVAVTVEVDVTVAVIVEVDEAVDVTDAVDVSVAVLVNVLVSPAACASPRNAVRMATSMIPSYTENTYARSMTSPPPGGTAHVTETSFGPGAARVRLMFGSLIPFLNTMRWNGFLEMGGLRSAK